MMSRYTTKIWVGRCCDGRGGVPVMSYGPIGPTQAELDRIRVETGDGFDIVELLKMWDGTILSRGLRDTTGIEGFERLESDIARLKKEIERINKSRNTCECGTV